MPRFARLPAALAALLVVAALPACDSQGDELSADVFVGTWTLTDVRDASGDRTAQVDLLLDALTATFRADGTFTLDVDYSALAEAGGASDVAASGTFSVIPGTTARTGTLALTQGEVSAPLTVNVLSNTEIELSAPAAIVTSVLGGASSVINLTGTVVLTIER